MITQLSLQNFKAFSNFTMTFGRDAFIVGPNNAGKSTLIAAVRLCAAMLRLTSRKAPSVRTRDRGMPVLGYPLIAEQLGFVDENLRHEFHEAETRLSLRFGNKAEIRAVWPSQPSDDTSSDDEEDDARNPYFYLYVEDRAQPRTPRDVKSAFPDVGVVPMLSPVEHEEDVLEDSYVRRNVDGRLTSRHFRNQLRLLGEEYSPTHSSRLTEFFAFAEEWLPEIELDELRTRAGGKGLQLDLFYREGGLRAEKEIFWAGDGIQVWLELLLHVFRLRDATTILFDEPDVFLHADLQRRLVRLLEGLDSQTITATHSPEMLAEASPESIIWVDKSRRRAVRGPQAAVLAEIAEAIGSQFNLRLAKALRSKVVLFVEGKDMKVIRSIARTVGAARLANETGVAIVPLEGFTNWEHVEPFAWLVKNLLEESVHVFVVLDRDYRSDSSARKLTDRLGSLGIVAHVWQRKELESYLLSPTAIARATKADPTRVDMMMSEIVSGMHSKVFARALDQKLREDIAASAHRVTVTERFQPEFDEMWADPARRLDLCPPKEIIRELNRALAEEKLGQISARSLSRTLRPAEVPGEMRDVLLAVEAGLG